MSKLRSINTRIWSDSWFEELNPTSKLLFIYLITNEANNMLGIYEISLRKISFETGIDKSSVEKALEGFERIKKVRYVDDHIILTNFIKHQCYNTNMKKSAIDSYNLLPSSVKMDGIDFIESPTDSRDKEAYNQLVSKGFQRLCESFGILRKIEVEDEVEKEDEIKDESKIDFGEFKNYWNANCGNIPKVNEITEGRKKLIRTILKSHPKSALSDAILKMKASNFLQGRQTDFKCSIDFFLKYGNFVKIIEGNYDNNKAVKINQTPEKQYGHYENIPK